MLNSAAYVLLWFRPLSPLHYTLPAGLAGYTWADTQHIPIDVLQPCAVAAPQLHTVQAAATWVLSSPTAAHLAADLGSPSTIAVMGTPTQAAWREAGGAEPAHWLVSPTGESMGLQGPLRQHSRIAVLRGTQGRNDLIEALQAAGLVVNTIAVYEKSQHPAFEQRLNSALTQAKVCLCLTSVDQAARVLTASANQALCLRSPVLASHPRITQAAQALGFERVETFSLPLNATQQGTP